MGKKTKLTVVEGGKAAMSSSDEYPPGHPEAPASFFPRPGSKPAMKPAKKSRKKGDDDGGDAPTHGRWREKDRDKRPLGSLYNSRKAIDLLGIECSFDVFHNRLLIGQAGSAKFEVDQRLIGDVSDDSLLALRQIISDEFGFDPGNQYVRDAVVSKANENRFDPVADLIDEAEATWDGVERLDRMAAEFLNCEDTPLNAAVVRKMMIAAVARVRHPGCKHDAIVVFESPEGFNKSTAVRVLAGDENFSDEPVIGRDSREVMEQLGGVWFHESADLAGMSKREVETVKAFASRTVDRARPAYGHFVKEQRRHCVMVGTTNSNEYLQSQTGNRRFQPVKVLASIDIEKLAEFRLQLIGEAAHYEREGESLVIDQALWGDAAVEQEKRRVKDSWEDALDDIHEGYIHISEGQERISSKTLLKDVLEILPAHQGQGLNMRLSTVMKRLGWQRHDNGSVTIRGERVKGFWRPTEREPAEPPKPLPETRAQALARQKALPEPSSRRREPS